MNRVVITGSTTGIGLGLAEAFLHLGCEVVVNGRSQERVEAAVQTLQERTGKGAFGVACDVRDRAQVQTLWESAREHLGEIDFWLNNAGTIHPQLPFAELTPDQLSSVVDTNVMGLVNGCHVALQGMLAQGHGQIFVMEGFGSNDMMRPGMTLYGTTKRAARYFSQSLIRETRGTPVKVCTMSPGIVITDLLRWSYEQGAPENLRWAKWMFNLVADEVEVVCPWLAKKILSNNKHGRFVNWFSWWRFVLYGLRFPFRKRVF